MQKRGQVAIFIIIAIVIVAAILLFVFIKMDLVPEIPIGSQVPQNPEAYVITCIEPHVKEAVNLISSQGGYIEPNLSKKFNENQVAYLCYNQNFYSPCINQEPMLLKHLKDEIKTYISDDVENCFQEMRTTFEEQNYNVVMDQGDFDIELMPSKVVVDVSRNVQLSKTGETLTYNEFKLPVFTKFYDNAVVVQEIVSQEARFCNFEQQGYMLFYPDFDIDQFRTGDLDIIYTVQNRKTEEGFVFAVKGCTIPPGIG